MFTYIKILVFRYWKIEIVCLLAVLLTTLVTTTLKFNNKFVAITAWLVDFPIFYTMDYILHRKKEKSFKHHAGRKGIEFVLPGMFNFWLIRPLLLYWTPIWLGSMVTGTLVGKILADLSFYLMASASYLLSLKIIPEKQA